MALTLVGNSITWLVKECDICVLVVTGEAVGADVVLFVNCGVGAVAREEKSHGMRTLISTTQHTWSHLFTGLMHRQYPLKEITFP